FFFFSSRRRHTRCYRDWSSDVCSSDLSSGWMRKASTFGCDSLRSQKSPSHSTVRNSLSGGSLKNTATSVTRRAIRLPVRKRNGRSEERRVGKEWRTRGAQEREQATRTT